MNFIPLLPLLEIFLYSMYPSAEGTVYYVRTVFFHKTV